MNDCDININTIVKEYMQYGWINLKNLFKKDKIAKSRMTKNVIKYSSNSYILELLGSTRKFMIDQVFQCYNKDPDTTYIVTGTTNLLSDYDITLTGPNSPDLMLDIFNHFIATQNVCLPYAFDTNIYCTGIFSLKNSLDLKEKIPIDTNIMTLSPYTTSQKKHCIDYALIKLIETNKNNLFNLCPSLYTHLQNAYVLQKNLIKKFENLEIRNKRYDKISLGFFKKYVLYYNYAKEVYDILYYNPDRPRDMLFDLLGTANFYSADGYYTPCALNVVVLNLQNNKGLKLRDIDYLCAAIEVIGDFNKNFNMFLQNEQGERFSDKYILLKLSKYIHRIYFSLGYNNLELFSKGEEIKTHILPYRGSEEMVDANKVDLSALGYKDDMVLTDFIFNLNKEFLQGVENFYKNLKWQDG